MLTGTVNEARAAAYESLLEGVEGVDDVTAWHDEQGGRVEVRIDISADTVDRTEMLAILAASLHSFDHWVKPYSAMTVDLTVYASDGRSCVTPQDLSAHAGPNR